MLFIYIVIFTTACHYFISVDGLFCAAIRRLCLVRCVVLRLLTCDTYVLGCKVRALVL